MPRRIPVLEQRHEAGLRVVARPLVFTSRIVVESPKDGAIVTGDAFEMSGTYVGEIPTGHEIWVLSHDQYNYFLVYPPAEVYRRGVDGHSMSASRTAMPRSGCGREP